MAENKSKYRYSSSQSKRRKDILEETQDKIDKIKEYKPTKLEGVEQNTYNNRLPKRPGMPKLPKLSGIKSKKVSKPSGLKGNIKDFKPKELNVSKVYKNLPKDIFKSKKPGKK